MKRLFQAAIIAVALFAAQSAFADGWVVQRVTAPAKYTQDGENWKAVSPGMTVPNSVWINTGEGGRVLLLDLSNCVNMDSTFLGILMGMTGRLDRIELLNPSERIIGLLDNLGVMDMLTVGKGTNPFEAELAAADSANADKRSLTEASLEAHKLLMKINPENVPRFKDVAKFLEENLDRQK